MHLALLGRRTRRPRYAITKKTRRGQRPGRVEQLALSGFRSAAAKREPLINGPLGHPVRSATSAPPIQMHRPAHFASEPACKLASAFLDRRRSRCCRPAGTFGSPSPIWICNGIIDFQVTHRVEHACTCFVFARYGPKDPGVGLAQAVADLCVLRLQQNQLAGRGCGWRVMPAIPPRGFDFQINAPFLPEQFGIQARVAALVGVCIRTSNRSPPAHPATFTQPVCVLRMVVIIADHLGMTIPGCPGVRGPLELEPVARITSSKPCRSFSGDRAGLSNQP